MGEKKEKKNSLNFLFPVLVILVIIVGVGAVILIFSNLTADKLVCESKNAKITLSYNKNGVIGYSARKMSYDLDNQNEYIKKIGMDAYISEFSNWFESETSGKCHIK